MLTLTKRTRFCCSHKLYNPLWDKDKNKSVFGPCSNMHGHNYVLEVTVSGPVDNESGMIINLNTLNKIINEEIIAWVDHKNLNTDINEFKDKLPTVENMAVIFFNKLKPVLPQNSLRKITLYETDDNKAEYTED